jgi:TonB family protein
MSVAPFDICYLRFFALSLALHGALLLVVRLQAPVAHYGSNPIAVTILTPTENSPKLDTVPTEPRAPETLRPTVRKNLPRPGAKAVPPGRRTVPPPTAAVRPELQPPPPPDADAAAAPASRSVPVESVVVERPLPSLKELLPPPTWSAGASMRAPISLNSKDPVYVTYFTKIKQSIESQWQYPELALRYGLQGRLSLEFTIGPLGELERLRVIRSSGSQLLDDEAMRAIKAAAPFPPIPPWIKPVPLSVSAAMEYHDNRVKYDFNR